MIFCLSNSTCLLGSSIKKSSLKERMVFVVIKIITQELEIESNLKQRLEFICEFCHIKPTIINGSIRKIDKTNLSYIEPHKIIVKDTTFLAFNYSTDIYVGSLNKKIQLVELEDYIKKEDRIKGTKISPFLFAII